MGTTMTCDVLFPLECLRIAPFAIPMPTLAMCAWLGRHYRSRFGSLFRSMPFASESSRFFESDDFSTWPHVYCLEGAASFQTMGLSLSLSLFWDCNASCL